MNPTTGSSGHRKVESHVPRLGPNFPDPVAQSKQCFATSLSSSTAAKSVTTTASNLFPTLASNQLQCDFFPDNIDQPNVSFPKLPRENRGHHHNQQHLSCPRCYNFNDSTLNWCAYCGELLIGATSAPTSHNPFAFTDCMPSTDSFANHHTGLHDSTEMLQFTYGLPEAHSAAQFSTPPHGAHQLYFSVGPELNLAHSFKSQSSDFGEMPSFMAERMNPTFQVAETNIPIYSPQMDSLHSRFDELRFSGAPLVPVRGQPEVGTTGLKPHLSKEIAAACSSSSYPTSNCQLMKPECWHTNPDALNNHRYGNAPVSTCQSMRRLTKNRQRCTSGPVRHIDGPWLQPQQDSMPKPMFQPLSSSYSPPMLPNHSVCGCDLNMCTCPWNMIPTSAGGDNQHVKYAEHSKDQPSGHSDKKSHRYRHDPIARGVTFQMSSRNRAHHHHHHGGGGGGTGFRRKHPSECSRNPFYPVPSNSVSGFNRPRSLSSDLKTSNQPNHQPNQLTVNEANCRWQSSRTAWSFHDPSILKKKPASYIRASFSHRPANNILHSGPVNPSVQSQDYNSTEPVTYAFASADLTPVASSNPTRQSKHDHRPNRGSNSHPVSQRSTLGCPGGDDDDDDVVQDEDVDLGQGGVGDRNVGNLDNPCFALTGGPSFESGIDLDPVRPRPDWMSLPDELWLAIFRPLGPSDRSRLALTCRHLANLMVDRSLWRVINLHRNQHLTDKALVRIAKLMPRELRFTYCRGNSITADGLKSMFTICGRSLQKLSLIGCTKGPFDCDLPLRLVAQHCHNLKHVNASYTKAVRDQTVIALAKSAAHLISVKLNGAQHISNEAIQQLVRYHESTLERLELFGCFRLNSDIFSLLGRCQELRALAFGHLHHLSSDGLLELVGKLPHLASLDLRGTQNLANDDNLSQLAVKCPLLEEVVLANMISLKRETGIAQMLRRLPRLRVLDLCGLAAVGDLTMEALATGCPQLEELDVSCTSVTQKGLSYLINNPANCLRCLRISHCREITKDVLEKLVRACPKLTLLYTYGFTSITDWTFLQEIRPTLLVESCV